MIRERHPDKWSWDNVDYFTGRINLRATSETLAAHKDFWMLMQRNVRLHLDHTNSANLPLSLDSTFTVSFPHSALLDWNTTQKCRINPHVYSRNMSLVGRVFNLLCENFAVVNTFYHFLGTSFGACFQTSRRNGCQISLTDQKPQNKNRKSKVKWCHCTTHAITKQWFLGSVGRHTNMTAPRIKAQFFFLVLYWSDWYNEHKMMEVRLYQQPNTSWRFLN